MPATANPTTEYALFLTQEEHAALLALLEREVADIQVECRLTDTLAYHVQLREEEIVLRLLAAKVKRMTAS